MVLPSSISIDFLHKLDPIWVVVELQKSEILPFGLTMSEVLLDEGTLLDSIATFLACCHDVVGFSRGGGFCGDFRS